MNLCIHAKIFLNIAFAFTVNMNFTLNPNKGDSWQESASVEYVELSPLTSIVCVQVSLFSLTGGRCKSGTKLLQ